MAKAFCLGVRYCLITDMNKILRKFTKISQKPKNEVEISGTGTSQGIPVIGSTHPVCLSTNPKDKRLRSSVMITDDEGKKILIDCGPDFRQQMLTNQRKQCRRLINYT